MGDHEKCQKYLEKAYTSSPIVIFMLQQLEKAGCAFNPTHFKCIPCIERNKGGFSPQLGIFLCENRITSYQDVEDTLAHQMVHAFDHCTTTIDWSRCKNYACSEIRALTLSGECKWSREFFRGNFGLKKQHQKCVKRKAIELLEKVPEFKDNARDTVEAVFDSCFADTAPFDEIF